MNGLAHYLSCAVLWLGLAARAPDLVRHRRDPYLRSLCAVLGLAGLCFLLGAPPTVGAVNRLSGVPNLAAPLTYASITAYSAAAQVLIVQWRGGPRVRSVVRRWVLAYTLVVLGIAVTFALGDAPVERRTDLDTYYATTPFIGQMIVLYLAAHLTAATVTAVSALRWARQVRGALRVGLAVLGAGALCNAGYSVSRLAAVAARWSGRDWPVLVTGVSPAAAAVSALLTVAGMLIPLLAPWAVEWRRAARAYARLAPLERVLDEVLTRRALRLPRPRLATPATRLMWRQTSIHNALSHLAPYLDGALYDRVREAALRAGDDAERAEARAWAAVVVPAARDAELRDTAPGGTYGGPRPGTPRRLPDRLPGPEALGRVADALAAAGPLAAARERDPAALTGRA
ncbi:MAB_1171c family putative transporter [Streptomyces sp. NPDC018947]|uniref:MAB_1171c family putative transporter n=1 Tax=Streptomyces sp. NPDC018947 TaxID=3365054 RepID=UPI00378BC7EE